MPAKKTFQQPEFPELPWIDPKEILLIMTRAGYTNEEIASAFGMTARQLDTLLNKDPLLRRDMDEAKEEPNFKVEQALFKRALGYPIREVVEEDGRPTKVVMKEIAPDPVSCIFWLKNRSPKKWRDVIEHKFTLRDRMERAHEALNDPNRPALTDGKKE